MADIEERIFEAITTLGDQATGPAIARYVERSEGYIYTVLSRMIREGEIEKVGHGGPYARSGSPRSLIEYLTIAKFLK